jgi:LPXTG-motif cell wall-anchored protein
VLFSGEGEAPTVTIYPKSTQQFWIFRPETIAIVIASLGLVSLGIGVIYTRRRKRKLSN